MGRRKEKFITKLKNWVFTFILVGIMLFWVQGYTNASGLKFVQISDDHFLKDAPNTTFKMTAESPKLLDDAIVDVNYIMRQRGIAADLNFSLRFINRKLHFVAVMPRVCHADNRKHLAAFNVPDTFQRVLHLLALNGKLPFIT